MLFKEVIGNQNIKEKLIRTVKEGRVSHSQLFSGPEGSGNLAMAIAYAQYLSCTNQGENDSCGACSSCIKFQKLSHPDLHFVFPVASTTKVKKPLSKDFMMEWRELMGTHPYFSLYDWYKQIGIENKQGQIGVDESADIIRTLSYKAYEGAFKMMIIWMPEKMNKASANKLLKIVEEPTQKTLFLFVANQEERIIKTILSRTQIVRIPAIDDRTISEALVSQQKVKETEAETIAQMCEGDYNKALKILSDPSDNDLNNKYFIQWMRMCFRADLPGIVRWVEEIARIGREAQKNFLAYTLTLIQQALMLHYQASHRSQKQMNQDNFSLEKFAPFIHGRNIMKILDEFQKGHYHIERNANPKILFLDLSIKMTKLLRVKMT